MLKNGKLIPETVKHDAVEIGRFEVTRAQFAEFDKGCVVESGHENFPANGITFNQAKSYCGWLSKLTGENYRLPGPAESDSLYGKSSGSENTLDYWAGATVNPDDSEKLRSKIMSSATTPRCLKKSEVSRQRAGRTGFRSWRKRG